MYYQVKSKKAVSIMVGYVLLVTFAVIIGVIVYQWMKTYVPQDELNCPDGVSLFIEDYSCSSNILTLNLKNNGKFNIGGYFIYATDSPEEELATIDLSKNNTDASLIIQSMIKFESIGSVNSLKPNNKETHSYDLTGIRDIYSIEILPIRWQEEKNRNVLVSCKDTKIRESIECDIDYECVPYCVGKDCGDDGCGGSCGSCVDPEICNPTGQCVPPEECTDTCVDLGWVCGVVCEEDCGECPTLDNALNSCNLGSCVFSCNVGWCDSDGDSTNGCEKPLGTLENCESCGDVCTAGNEVCIDGSCTSCNGVWISPEDLGVECDGTPLPANCLANCTCIGEYVSDGIGGCKIPDTVSSCPGYCSFLSYTAIPPGYCTSSSGVCVSGGGTYELIGDQWCTGGPQADTCCCKNSGLPGGG